MRLRFLGEASTDTQELRHGGVDLEVGSAEPTQPDLRHEAIGVDRLVVLRPGHPAAGGRFTLARYTGAWHLTVSRRGCLRDPVDEALAARGLRRNVVASAPTSTAALQLIRRSDLLVAVPQAICRVTLDDLGLLTRPMPLPLKPVPIIQVWHRRYDTDPAHRWLRAQVRGALQTTPDGEGEAG